MRADAGGDEDGVALRADRGIGIDAGGGDADRRIRLLAGLWHQCHLVVGEIFSAIREALLGPGPLDDLQRLGEALAAFLIGNAVGLISAGKPAASDTEDEAPVADLVDGGGLLGEPQRMAERQHLDCGADLHPPRALRNGGGQDQGRGQHRAIGHEMQLRKPHGVEPPLFGGVDQLEGLREGFGFARCPGIFETRGINQIPLPLPTGRFFDSDGNGHRNGCKRL